MQRMSPVLQFRLPMECRYTHQIPAGEDWQYELKLDGYRCQVIKQRGEVHLYSRTGKSFDELFPEIADSVLKLKVKECILDGEVVALLPPRSNPLVRPTNNLLRRRTDSRTGPLPNNQPRRRIGLQTVRPINNLLRPQIDSRTGPLPNNQSRRRTGHQSVRPINSPLRRPLGRTTVPHRRRSRLRPRKGPWNVPRRRHRPSLARSHGLKLLLLSAPLLRPRNPGRTWSLALLLGSSLRRRPRRIRTGSLTKKRSKNPRRSRSRSKIKGPLRCAAAHVFF